MAVVRHDVEKEGLHITHNRGAVGEASSDFGGATGVVMQQRQQQQRTAHHGCSGAVGRVSDFCYYRGI